MVIRSSGFVPQVSIEEQRRLQALFTENLSLIRGCTSEILNCAEYFFCDLPFAYCSLPYITGDGMFGAGHLILAWQAGLFTSPCPDCGRALAVFRFAGSILSGNNSCSGYCDGCMKVQTTSFDKFAPHWRFALHVRQQYACSVDIAEERDGVKFTWGGTGLALTREFRRVARPVCEAVDLPTLVAELSSGNLRPSNPPNVASFDRRPRLKLDGITY